MSKTALNIILCSNDQNKPLKKKTGQERNDSWEEEEKRKSTEYGSDTSLTNRTDIFNMFCLWWRRIIIVWKTGDRRSGERQRFNITSPSLSRSRSRWRNLSTGGKSASADETSPPSYFYNCVTVCKKRCSFKTTTTKTDSNCTAADREERPRGPRRPSDHCVNPIMPSINTESQQKLNIGKTHQEPRIKLVWLRSTIEPPTDFQILPT